MRREQYSKLGSVEPVRTTGVHPVLSHEIFASQDFGGISRYMSELHNTFRRLGVASTLLAPLYKTDSLRGSERVVGIRIPKQLQVRGTGQLASWIGRLVEPPALALLGRRHTGLVLHKSYYPAMPPPRHVANAITVHDMAHELHPSAFPLDDSTSIRKQVWCEKADVVIAVSHYTKSQLVSLFDIDPDRVVVCHHGVTKVDPDVAALEALHNTPPFLLYVGGRRGHKNFDRLTAAYAQSSAAGDGTRLIAFGGGPPDRPELARLEKLGIFQLVTFATGGDAVLAAHYAAAIGLLYPSIDEGFGFPPLEAMQHRCPVGAARAGAIPEIVQDAAVLFDPVDEDAMAKSIDRLVADSVLRARLSEEGVAQASTFSWEAAAKTTLTAYALALTRAGEHA